MVTAAELTEFLKNILKIWAVSEEDGKIYLSVVRGIDLDIQPHDLLISKIPLEKTAEIMEILELPDIKAKLYQPSMRGIILVDIVGYSKFDTSSQASILSVFTECVTDTLKMQRIFSLHDAIEGFVPTGDGCYIVFKEHLNDRFFRMVFGLKADFYCRQGRILRSFKDKDITTSLQLRIACGLGEVDRFRDMAGHENFYGVGMNEMARVLQCGSEAAKQAFPALPTEGTIFFDESVHSQLADVFEFINSFSKESVVVKDLGQVSDKHGMTRRVYWATNIPNHVGITFDSIFGQAGGPQPYFIKK